MTLQLPGSWKNKAGFHQGVCSPGWGYANTCPAAQFQNRNQPGYLNKLFQETDLNKDKDLTFKEFTIVLAKVTDDAHRIIHKDDRCTPDKD